MHVVIRSGEKLQILLRFRFAKKIGEPSSHETTGLQLLGGVCISDWLCKKIVWRGDVECKGLYEKLKLVFAQPVGEVASSAREYIAS
jgi:hypothetical protein